MNKTTRQKLATDESRALLVTRNNHLPAHLQNMSIKLFNILKFATVR